MSRKVIGIPGYAGKDSNNFGVGNHHLEFVSRFGDARIIMPWEEKADVDLLYLPGGLDTAPMNYGAIPAYTTSAQDVFKEHFLLNNLKNYIDDTPIFGVCLGMQQLAVHFGCRLTQDFIYHAQSTGRWQPAHKIYSGLDKGNKVIEKSKLPFEVNSHHHQGLTVSGLSDQIIPIFYADNEDDYYTNEGAIVEAFRHVTLPIYGIQWHPEELYDQYTKRVIEQLLADEI